MIFEFIIAHQPREDEPILSILLERLLEALEANLNDVENDSLNRMVQIMFERPQPTNADSPPCAVLSFSLDLSEDTTSIRDVIDMFAESLMAEPIKYLVKYEDPLLRAELSAHAENLFALEMKLRRVLSIIYLNAYPGTDPYDLLTEETVQPLAKEKPQMAQMKAAAENQFFHLTFGQYVSLNQRPPIKDLVSLIRNKEAYEAFRDEVLRQPIEHEVDASFLASLKGRMDVIEKMRNAVAHNRRPSRKVTEDFTNVLPLVNQVLDEYFSALAANWHDLQENSEMSWDISAQAAVTNAMESASWDEVDKTIKLYDPNGTGMGRTVSSRDELATYLGALAREAFYADCPREDGEFLFECDEDDIIESVFADYEEQLTKFFTSA